MGFSVQLRISSWRFGIIGFLVGTILCGVESCSTLPSSRFYRLRIKNVRDPQQATGVEIGEVEIATSSGIPAKIQIGLYSASSTLQGQLVCDNSQNSCFPYAAFDGILNLAWEDSDVVGEAGESVLLIDFGVETEILSYEIYTGKGSTANDATNWIFEMYIPPEPSPPAGPVSPQSIKVIPLGDSLAAGYPCTCGWRDELKQELQELNIDVTFEGTINAQFAPIQNCPEGCPILSGNCHHEGHGSNTIAELKSVVEQSFGPQNPQDNADFILLLIGTKDCFAARTFNYFNSGSPSEKMEELIITINALRPNSHIIIATVTPLTSQTRISTLIPIIRNISSSAIPNLQSQGYPVSFADTYTNINPWIHMADVVHTNDVGCGKQAEVLSDVIYKVLAKKQADGGLGTIAPNADWYEITSGESWVTIDSQEIPNPTTARMAGYGNIDVCADMAISGFFTGSPPPMPPSPNPSPPPYTDCVDDLPIDCPEECTIICAPKDSTSGVELVGTDECDCIVGTQFADVIYAGGGQDIVNGGSGNDIIWGGNGNDILKGASGADTLYGEQGLDTLLGNNGRDFIRGGDGKDLIEGGRGKNFIFGESGKDRIIIHKKGKDVVTGGKNKDTIEMPICNKVAQILEANKDTIVDTDC